MRWKSDPCQVQVVRTGLEAGDGRGRMIELLCKSHRLRLIDVAVRNKQEMDAGRSLATRCLYRDRFRSGKVHALAGHQRLGLGSRRYLKRSGHLVENTVRGRELS